ncbi:MAG: DoxX family protein [Acidimicrobiia bacterium]|nr:MAG: DoxX family protein [Acidimicrobiia bacterium]
MESFDIASLILRLALGVVMLAHGIKHARGRQKTSNWFGSIGFKSPDLQWFASTATEIGVGLLLIGGFLTTAAAAGVIGVMTVAYVSVHRAVGFWVTARPDEGWEYVMTLSAVAAAIAIAGPGEASIDAALGLDTVLDGWIGFGAVVLGVAVAGIQLATFFRPEASSQTSGA